MCCLSRCVLGGSANGRELKVEGMTQQTILVVDDEAPMRKLIASNLRVSGYGVHTAADGTEALKLIEEHPFDLLLLDINIPGPNGLQVLEAVRRGTEMPILMVSARGNATRWRRSIWAPTTT